MPTDFSRASARALECAVGLANQYGAVLTILHVININGQADSETSQELMKRLWTEGSSQMAQLAWALCGQVEAQTQLQEGLPWEKIVEQGRDFDLLILGKKNAKARAKLFSKHTTQRVIDRAVCPVLLVPEQS